MLGRISQAISVERGQSFIPLPICLIQECKHKHSSFVCHRNAWQTLQEVGQKWGRGKVGSGWASLDLPIQADMEMLHSNGV